jgi:hypothetical protein
MEASMETDFNFTVFSHGNALTETHHLAAPHVMSQKSLPQFSKALLVSLHLCKGRFL